MSQRRVIFHIGLAKTGTTSLQRFCAERRLWLLERGVLYPRAQMGRARNHSPLAASYIAHRSEGPTVAMRWATRADAVRSLVAEIERSPAATVLISSEHLASHFERPEAEKLAADFAAYDCTVVVTLRDPHARFLSAYNTHVTAGGHRSIERYAGDTLIPDLRHSSGRETLRIWASAFGAEAIRVIDYDGGGDVPRQVLACCGIAGDVPGLDGYRDRPSHSPAVVNALRALNYAIADGRDVIEGGLVGWLRATIFSILCRRALLRHDAGRYGGEWVISPRTMAGLDRVAAEDRNWVADTFGIALRGCAVRERIVVRDRLPGEDEAQALLARALLDRIAGGLWRPSGMLVALAGALPPLRPTPPAVAIGDGPE